MEGELPTTTGTAPHTPEDAASFAETVVCQECQSRRVEDGLELRRGTIKARRDLFRWMAFAFLFLAVFGVVQLAAAMSTWQLETIYIDTTTRGAPSNFTVCATTEPYAFDSGAVVDVQFQLYSPSQVNCSGDAGEWFEQRWIAATPSDVCRPPGTVVAGLSTGATAVIVPVTGHSSNAKWGVIGGSVVFTVGTVGAFVFGGLLFKSYRCARLL